MKFRLAPGVGTRRSRSNISNIKKGIVIPMKKKAVLAALLTLTALFAAVIPTRADLIDPDLLDPELLNPVVTEAEEEPEEPAEEPEPAETEEADLPDTEATNASSASSAESVPNNNRVDSEAKSLSSVVTALAAGVLLIAVAALIRAIIRNHREAKIDRGMRAK